MSTAPSGGAPSSRHNSISMNTVAAVISASVNIVAVTSTTCARFAGGVTSDTTLPTT